MIASYDDLRKLALSLDLPEVADGTAWGHPCLRAHGKMWVWWSPLVDAAVFFCDFEEREMLLAADPETFTLHPHYAPHRYVLVRAGRVDPDWARVRLARRWRELAPRRWLKAWDAARGG